MPVEARAGLLSCLPPQHAHGVLLQAIHREGWRLTDNRVGLLAATSGAGLLTWGERITVELRPTPDGGTEIVATSALRFGLVDWGRNDRNLQRLFHGYAQMAGEMGR